MDQAKRVVIVGAGAAGIIAAWRAASLGAKVLLLEKTRRVGTKILISGGGKCNVCHDGPMQHVLSVFRPNERDFLRHACYQFPNRRIAEMLTSRGLELYTRPNGRIFPQNGDAKDVVAILQGYLREAGVETRLDARVTGVEARNGAIVGVYCRADFVPCDRLILCVGGASYPASGTSGDGYAWAAQLGHTIEPIKAALAPMELMRPFTHLSGVALRGVLLRAKCDGKDLHKWTDDLLFTHHGVSGPCALEVSRSVAERLDSGPVNLVVDLAPTRSFESLREELLALQQRNPHRKVATFLDDLVPERVSDEIVASLDLSDFKSLSQKLRNRLIETIKGWDIGEVKRVVLDRGEVVAGGVRLSEVDPRTMASAKCKGLFLAGEILDVAGPVGGYNLQAAFATGYVAGESAAS